MSARRCNTRLCWVAHHENTRMQATGPDSCDRTPGDMPVAAAGGCSSQDPPTAVTGHPVTRQCLQQRQELVAGKEFVKELVKRR
ncbi:hypothetical protein NDU88_003346 [Pleurodeles waltl]|uniref:Uncharacterized protein n=1 Tax=Pleurodeles waltl TaxID=8319 RepID=A0AAV7T523_PLEWA|nr:hypothetical protein NDU88_003346 [Pleurodeles waltl]